MNMDYLAYGFIAIFLTYMTCRFVIEHRRNTRWKRSRKALDKVWELDEEMGLLNDNRPRDFDENLLRKMNRPH